MRILITAGPTREYVDDVRFLSNASSGRMGYSIAEAACRHGHEVVLVTGPTDIPVPDNIECHAIETTDELQTMCRQLFPDCDGVIATAAVCDYRPRQRVKGKITKTGEPIIMELVETSDVLAELGRTRERQWIVGFALESQDPRNNAMRKLRMKNCDCIVLNDTSAISSLNNTVEVLSPDGSTLAEFTGSKPDVAEKLMQLIETSIAVSGRGTGK